MRIITRFYLLLFILSFIHFNGYAQTYDYKENSVYIYNFIKYTVWPAHKTTVTIGLLGNSPVENELKILFAKKKNTGAGITYSVKKITVDECKGVDVILVCETATDKLRMANKLTEKLPILIITERGNQSHAGACISFFIDEDHDYKTEYQLSIRNCKMRGLVMGEQIQNNAELIR